MSTTANLLKELIIQKYGIEKIDTGCRIVAQWLTFETGCAHTRVQLHELCLKKSTPRFTRIQKTALKKLFGKSFDP